MNFLSNLSLKKLDQWGWISLLLLVIGGLDLGIFGLIHVELIGAIFGNLLSRLIFIVMGVGAGYIIYLLFFKKGKGKENA